MQRLADPASPPPVPPLRRCHDCGVTALPLIELVEGGEHDIGGALVLDLDRVVAVCRACGSEIA